MKRKKHYAQSFLLIRKRDETGISGKGIVAHGVVFHSGRVALEWLRPPYTIGLYGSIQEMIQVHGHGGNTRVRFCNDQANR
jgi:hypothetical protein